MSRFTKPELDALGARLRDADRPSDGDLALYADYREEFAAPLAEVTAVLTAVAAESLPPLFGETATRLKAVDSVIRKLRRKADPLSAMQDIAGCRLTVRTLMDITHIGHLLGDRFEIVQEKAYTKKSKAGYRAHHLIVRAPSGGLGDSPLVEVQLRTEIQHAWANLSEFLAYSIDRSIKAGGGTPELRTRLEDLSEQGKLIDEGLDWVEASRGAFADMHAFLERREAGDWIIHHQMHIVEDIQSLLRVALRLHGDLVDAFHWQLDEFKASEGGGPP